MDIETLAVDLTVLIRRQRNLVLYRLPVIGDLQVRIINTVEFPQHFYKVRLSMEQSVNGESGRFPECGDPKMFDAENTLSFHEFPVKFYPSQKMATGPAPPAPEATAELPTTPHSKSDITE